MIVLSHRFVLLFVFSATILRVGGFLHQQRNRCDARSNVGSNVGSTSLFMGKKLRNRQAELQRKMMLAKQQRVKRENTRLTDEELKEINDRKRFDELLNSDSATIRAAAADDGGSWTADYLTSAQEEEVIDAQLSRQKKRRGAVERLFEGDPVRPKAFEELVSIKSESAIGEPGASRLFRNSPFIAVVCDPRGQSPEFRAAVAALSSDLTKDVFSKIVFVNADSPAENRRLLKKMKLADSSIRLFSDEKREWMQAYTALAKDRWTMTLFVLDEERIQRIVRDFTQYSAADVLTNAMKAAENRRY